LCRNQEQAKHQQHLRVSLTEKTIRELVLLLQMSQTIVLEWMILAHLAARNNAGRICIFSQC
jgi:hypothetical protein